MCQTWFVLLGALLPCTYHKAETVEGVLEWCHWVPFISSLVGNRPPPHAMKQHFLLMEKVWGQHEPQSPNTSDGYIRHIFMPECT